MRLAAIDRSARQSIDNAPADANPATAHMFIVNPLHGGMSRPVRQPSLDRGTHRAAARHGAGAPTHPKPVLGDDVEAIAQACPRAKPRWRILSGVLRQRRPLDAQLESSETLAAARCRFRARAGQPDLAPFRRAGRGDPRISCPSRWRRTKPARPWRSCCWARANLLILKVPAHAAVDAANHLAAADSKAVHFKPLINAVLRRIAREGEAVRASLDARAAQHARLAVDALERAIWRRRRARHRARASAAKRRWISRLKQPTALVIPKAKALFGLSRRVTDARPGRRPARLRRRRLVGAGRRRDLAGRCCWAMSRASR